MNYRKFKERETAATRHKMKGLRHLREDLKRDVSPVRGFFNRWYGREKYLGDQYQEVVEYILEYVSNSGLSEDVKSSIYAGESFQSKQKGPTAPLSATDYDKNIIGDIVIKDFDIAEEDKTLLTEIFESLMSYLSSFVKLDVLALNYAEEGKKLPNTTVRGYPGNSKGAKADPEIIAQGGETAQSALSFMLSDSQFICFPGFRIQGKPYPGPAKVRLVYIPPVHSQYFDNGIISESMRQLSKCPIFAGGQNPYDRTTTIYNASKLADQQGMTRIQLDYSKYDKHIHPFFQNIVAKYFEKVSVSGLDLIKKRNEQFAIFREDQGIFLSDSRNIPTGYRVPYQLPSGEKRTQHDGSLIGLLLMGYLWRKIFNANIPGELTNQLGDDAVFPVPILYLKEKGYEALLEDISSHLSNLGFHLNPTKAYPNSDMAFLQKLWVYDKKIYGIGTFTRSFASFIGREKRISKVKGIKNVGALELISQITIMSEPFSKSPNNIHGVAAYLAQGGLDRDKGLSAAINFLSKQGSLNEDNLFKFIIKLSGATFDEILNELGVLAYDHKGLTDAFVTQEYKEIFPILSYLISARPLSQTDDEIREYLNYKDTFDVLSEFEVSLGGGDETP